MDDYEKAYNEQFMRAEKLEERIKELQESHDAWEAGWRTMNTALLKAQERIKELENSHEMKFVRHIESHLTDNQLPICKICGKDIFEIAKEVSDE